MQDPKTKRPALLIYGASGHAKVVADAARLQGVYDILAFLDDLHPERHGDAFCGAKVLSANLESLAQQYAQNAVVHIAIGNCVARSALAARARAAGFSLATIIHPKAVVGAEVSLGAGTFVAAGAVISTGATLGRNVIVNTSASVDHDCTIADEVHIAPGARLAGSVRIGARTWIGLNACVLQERRVGAGVMVGAGAVVVTDLPDDVVAYGVPARIQCANPE